ncbi:hypothetical protein DPMN_121396 [Dreissena polymorpha]|uniref:Uncharacterized protein n=1 Tax=Dreissena polymorpha TaxID=45954 RepID=A0A9D4GMC7_DREPO|nr:hypothetical protein DPMN_121396 [Dreissena polymorpha]
MDQTQIFLEQDSYQSYCIYPLTVQHVLVKPEVKGLDGEVAGPPPEEPTYVTVILSFLTGQKALSPL